MRFVSKTFLVGVMTVLPLAVTSYLLWWLAVGLSALINPLVQWAFPTVHNWPGLGIAVALLLVFSVGLLMNAWIVRMLLAWGERLLQHIPIVKTLYGSLRDLASFLASTGENRGKNKQVVLVKLGDGPARLLGLLTRQDSSELPDSLGTQGTVAVYLPLSYAMGGYTVFVHRSAVEKVDMSVEDALRFIVTGGMSVQRTER